jgi:hypothetical protein
MTEVSAFQESLAVSALNDPVEWMRAPAFDGPLSASELASVQKQIDSILGVTRDNKSIATVVWNGDVRYWKQFYDDWDEYGNVRGGLQKRPWVLFRSIFDANDHFIRDAFPPRYLILTRLEPEQYADTWAETAYIWCPERQRNVQVRPTALPDTYFMWYRTIADHHTGCCEVAARRDMDCFGQYAHPASCLEELRTIRKGMDADKRPENHPFDSPDELAIRLRERSTNNYAEQAVRKYQAKASFLLDEAPLILASDGLLEGGASAKKISDFAREQLKRGQDVLERELKEKGAF